jgi:hypothetical protein
MEVQMPTCKRWLGGLWFSFAALLFLVLIVQTIFGHYGAQPDEAWGWLLPSILPTLSLMIAVLVMDALGKSTKAKTVDKFFFLLTFGVSAFYLVMVALPIFLQPFTTQDPLAALKQSNLWLGPLQGLVSGSLAAFFVKRGKA